MQTVENSNIFARKEHILHTAHEKEFRKGNVVALKRHGMELYIYRNLLMFVAKQTSPDR